MARPKSPEKKEWIRKAAIRVISEVGFHNCTTDKIAEEAGVSVGTIYNYFKDKKDILSYIFKIEQKKMNIYFKRFLKKDLSVPEKLEYLIDQYYKYVFNNKSLAKLVHDESNKTSRDLTQEMFNYLKAIRKHVKTLLEEGVGEGTIEADHDIEMMVNMVIGSANAIAFMGFIKPEKVEYICEHGPRNLYNMLASGILKN